MSNINGSRRYEVSLADVGDSAYVTSTSLLLDGSGVGPPGRGSIEEVRVVKTSGTGTQATLRLVQTSDSRVLVEYPLQDLPFVFADLPVIYEGTLQVEAQTDDTGDATDLDVEVVIAREA